MNRNQKIAIGCGGAGCLGLIFLVVVGAVAFYYSGRLSRTSSSDTNFNHNFNSNLNSNSNYRNSNSSSNANDDRTPDITTSLSDDDKHKLFQAVAVTSDSDLMHKVWKKLGLMDADNTPNENYAQFAREHIAWLFKNSDFLQEVNTPDKARAYVNEHIND